MVRRKARIRSEMQRARRHPSPQVDTHTRLPSRFGSRWIRKRPVAHADAIADPILGVLTMRNAEGMPVRPRWLALLCAAILTVATAPLRSADQPHGYLPPAYAIQGAKIIAGTGPPLESGTVVVRNGLIEAVGE